MTDFGPCGNTCSLCCDTAVTMIADLGVASSCVQKSGDLGLACVMNDAPHPLRSKWHIDLRNVKFRECVDHRVDDRGKTTGTSSFAAALGTQRVGLCR